MVDIVLRNIGKGAAKDVTFEFSTTMEAPESINNPLWVPVNEQPYFFRGIGSLAAGAEIRCFRGSMRALPKLLREGGLHDGITITSRYKSLTSEQCEKSGRLTRS